MRTRKSRLSWPSGKFAVFAVVPLAPANDKKGVKSPAQQERKTGTSRRKSHQQESLLIEPRISERMRGFRGALRAQTTGRFSFFRHSLDRVAVQRVRRREGKGIFPSSSPARHAAHWKTHKRQSDVLFASKQTEWRRLEMDDGVSTPRKSRETAVQRGAQPGEENLRNERHHETV